MVLDDTARFVDIGDDLLDEQPAVVEVRVRRLGRDLLHAASEVVVAIGMIPNGALAAVFLACH